MWLTINLPNGGEVRINASQNDTVESLEAKLKGKSGVPAEGVTWWLIKETMLYGPRNPATFKQLLTDPLTTVLSDSRISLSLQHEPMRLSVSYDGGSGLREAVID